MTKTPVILVIENSIDVTGALKSIARIAFDLQPFYSFQFIVPKKSKSRPWLESKGFSKIHELPMIELRKRFLSVLLYVPFLIINTTRLRKIVKKEHVSIIHSNDLYNLLPVMLSLLGDKTPYICHIRFLPDKFPPWLFGFWLKLHLNLAMKIIGVSKSLLNMLPESKKFVLIHDQLPISEMHPEISEPSQRKPFFVFLYLSNFMEGKGQSYAVEAFARIHEDLPNWKLRFVGSDMGLEKNRKYRANLEERAKALYVFEKTEWQGFVEDVEMEYKMANITLNFSESESFSITCLESLYFGRPVIASDSGGPAEIIDNNVSGILVENRNVEAMVMAMKNLGSNEKLRSDMGSNGRRISRIKFSPRNTSYRIKEIYDNLLGNS